MRRLTLLGLAALLAVGPAHALEVDPLVPPEITFGGQALATFDLYRGDADDEAVNFEDTSLLLGFSKYLFDDRYYGYGVFGLKAVDPDDDLGESVYLNHAIAGIGGRRFEVRVGRTLLPNTLLRFPTLRDDDLLDYTHVRNAQLAGHSDPLELYGGQVALDFYLTPLLSLGLAATARAEGPAAAASESSINGATLRLDYGVPDDLDIARGLTYAGIAVDYQRFDPLGPEAEGGDVTALLAGVSFNLSGNPEATWWLDSQLLIVRGEDVGSLAHGFQRARTDRSAAVAALRYAHRPYLQTRWQAALTFAAQDYGDFDAARSYAVVPSWAWRVGSEIDLVAQLAWQRWEGDLAAATGADDQFTAQLGIRIGFDHTFNPSVGRRDDILHLEHNMLWYGPRLGGH